MSTDLSAKNKQLEDKLWQLANTEKECRKLKADYDELEKEKEAIKTELEDKEEELRIAEDIHNEVTTQV